MKISLSWTPAGTTRASSFVLGDSPAQIPITNFRVESGRLIQPAQLFRADVATFYDRGNRRTTLSFETTRAFSNVAAAEAFVLAHDAPFPGEFDVVLSTGSGANASVTRYLAKAVVESLVTSVTGCTTRHTYKITGGAISTSAD